MLEIQFVSFFSCSTKNLLHQYLKKCKRPCLSSIEQRTKTVTMSYITMNFPQGFDEGYVV